MVGFAAFFQFNPGGDIVINFVEDVLDGFDHLKQLALDEVQYILGI